MASSNGRFALSLILILSGVLWSGDSLAQDKSASMGVMYGLSVPDAPNTVPHHLYGIKGDAYISPTISLGGYYLVSGASEGSGGEKFDYSIHGVEASYVLPSGQGATSVGVRAGLTKIHRRPVADKVIFSPYHYGMYVAHDFYVWSWLSLGFEGSYLHVQDSKTDKGGTRYELDSFNLINFMVTMQFRL